MSTNEKLEQTPMSEEQLEKKLQSIIDGLGEADIEEEEWYSEIIWDNFEEPENDSLFRNSRCIEDYFAVQAVKYPALIPKVRTIVTTLMEMAEDEDEESFCVDGEWTVGLFFAKRLALVSPDDVLLFSRYFIESDPDHTEDGLEPVEELIEHYGWQKNTISLLLAPFYSNSQHSSDIWTETMCEELNAFLQDKDNADAFLALFAEWASVWHAQPLPWLFESVLDDFLNVSENTDTKQLSKAYEKLAISGKVLTKEELVNLVAQHTT